MIIRNVTVLSFDDLSMQENVDLIVEDGLIERVVPRQAGQPAPETTGHDELDGKGMYCIPGLVNAHTHGAMALLRGAVEDVSLEDWYNEHIWVYESRLQPRDVYVGTLLAACEMLLSGVTAVADQYYFMDEAARAYRDAGMRADLAWLVYGIGEGWEEEYRRALQFAEDYRSFDPRITVSLGPHSPYLCPLEFLEEVGDRAALARLKVHIHVSEEYEQVERARREWGMTPVQALDRAGILGEGTILAHAYHATDDDLALIAERGAGVAHCPAVAFVFGDMHAFLPRALRARVRVGLGTASPAAAGSLSILRAGRDAALLAKAAVGAPEVARVSEIIPLLVAGGEVLGMRGYGHVQEGSVADLVLLDMNAANVMPEHSVWANILYAIQERNVHTVLVDGEVVVREGKLTRVDTAALYREASLIARRLGERQARRPAMRRQPVSG